MFTSVGSARVNEYNFSLALPMVRRVGWETMGLVAKFNTKKVPGYHNYHNIHCEGTNKWKKLKIENFPVRLI